MPLKHLKSYVSNIDEKTGYIEAIASTDSQDRDGDVILASAWNLENFEKNPLLLWSHEITKLPIGRVVKINNKAGQLEFTAEFAEKEDEFAKKVAKMYRNGFLNAFSVGYIPLESDNKGNITKAELLEISAVNVPANQDALIRREYKLFCEELKDFEKKDIIPFKSYPKDEGDWDAGAEVKKAEVDDLKIMCTWYDSENPDLKSSYKLPHHRAENKNTVWRGVTVAMAALLGARGGVDIPEADKKGVYNHLAKHYKEFDQEPPEFKTAEVVEKSPACRMEGETEQECVSRKIPEIKKENPDMKDDQVQAIAFSMCREQCGEKEKEKIEEINKKINLIDEKVNFIKNTLNITKKVKARKAKKRYNLLLLQALRVVDKAIEEAILLNKQMKKGGEKNKNAR